MNKISRFVIINQDKEIKVRCNKVLKDIIHFSNILRRQGIIELENELESHDDSSISFLLRKGLELIIEGESQQNIKRMMQNYIKSGNCKGIDYLEQLIIKEAVMLMQQGTRTRIILVMLFSLLGEEFFDEVERNELFSYIEEDLKKSYEKFLEQLYIKDIEDANGNETQQAVLIKNKIMNISNPIFMDKLVFLLGGKEICLALKGCNIKVYKHVIKNLSMKYIVEALNDMAFSMTMIRQEDIEIAQKLLLDTLTCLEKNERIV